MSYNKKYLISISSMIILVVIVIAIVITLPSSIDGQKNNSTQLENLQTNETNIVETYNVTNSNEISKYIPKNIKEITIINYLSDKNNPTTLSLKQVDKIKEYTDLLFKTNWDFAEKSETNNLIVGEYYEIKIIGDTELVLNMKNLKANNVLFNK